jgi:fatty acid synthase subunit alpha
MKSIFPAAIGDLLRLVHLSIGFRIVDGAKSLQVGEGKVLKVKGYVYCRGEQVIAVISSFLYRGRFNDYQNTF